MAGIAAGVELIATMDDADEIMDEFKRSLDTAAAIATVKERHRRIEAEKAARAEREAAKAQESEAVRKVEAFSPPVEQEPVAAQDMEPEKEYRCTFTVRATKPQLKRLKEFLNQEGIKYE